MLSSIRTVPRAVSKPPPRVRASTTVAMSFSVLAAGSAQPAVGTAQAPTFITTWSCPYAQRTWIALNEKGVPYTPVHVDLKAKPEWFFKWNPYGRVPTLVWQDGEGEASMHESLVCDEYVEEAFPGPSLLPKDPFKRAQVRLLIDQYGAKFSPAFNKVMFAANEADAAAAAKTLDEAVAWLESAIDATGPYATGPDFTLADCALAPFIIRLAVLDPLFGYSVPASATRLAAWRDACLARPSVAATIAPPDASRSYTDQMVEVYRAFTAASRSKAAAA
ncbi:MAG: glutathione S-transferase [Monoraphidium minutum]|nr:MAG: glutathione S-transferase [Monoraphidium minutum]